MIFQVEKGNETADQLQRLGVSVVSTNWCGHSRVYRPVKPICDAKGCPLTLAFVCEGFSAHWSWADHASRLEEVRGSPHLRTWGWVPGWGRKERCDLRMGGSGDQEWLSLDPL